MTDMTETAPTFVDALMERSVEGDNAELQSTGSVTSSTPTLHLLDDQEEFYVKIPLREYWELGDHNIRETIMASILEYEHHDMFFFEMDIADGITPPDNKCLRNLDYIEDSVWRQYTENN